MFTPPLSSRPSEASGGILYRTVSRSERGKGVCIPMRLRARFLHSAGFQPFSVEMTEGDPFDCAGRLHRPAPLRVTGEKAERAARPIVILSSSSLAHAVSILPLGKMHDLQGGSSSSQKSHFVAIFGSPIKCESKDLKVNVKCKM